MIPSPIYNNVWWVEESKFPAKVIKMRRFETWEMKQWYEKRRRVRRKTFQQSHEVKWTFFTNFCKSIQVMNFNSERLSCPLAFVDHEFFTALCLRSKSAAFRIQIAALFFFPNLVTPSQPVVRAVRPFVPPTYFFPLFHSNFIQSCLFSLWIRIFIHLYSVPYERPIQPLDYFIWTNCCFPPTDLRTWLDPGNPIASSSKEIFLFLTSVSASRPNQTRHSFLLSVVVIPFSTHTRTAASAQANLFVCVGVVAVPLPCVWTDYNPRCCTRNRHTNLVIPIRKTFGLWCFWSWTPIQQVNANTLFPFAPIFILILKKVEIQGSFKCSWTVNHFQHSPPTLYV